MIRCLFLVATVLACGKSKPPPDGIAVQVTGAVASLRPAITDAERRSWFIAEPSEVHTSDRDAVLCQLHGSALTCASIPGTAGSEDNPVDVALTDAAPGASPLVVVPTANGSRYLEPFTWRELHRIDGTTQFQRAVAYPDGSLVTEYDLRGIAIAAPSAPLRVLELSEHAAAVNVSRFGIVWSEYVDYKAPKLRLMSATLEKGELANVREVGAGQHWMAACREGNTFGYISTQPDKIEMIDLATGSRVSAPRNDVSSIACRSGEVGGFAVLQEHEDVHCTAAGCKPMRVIPDVPDFNYRRTSLVKGALLHVSTRMSDNRAIVRRSDRPHRALRIVGADELMNPDVQPVADGAVVLYFNGGLLLLDHEGTPKPLTLSWSGRPAVPR